MSNSLKDALEKAGLTVSKPKTEPKRKPKVNRPPSDIAKHQQQHYSCDYCKKHASDVEFYKHNNSSIRANWLCMVCADKHLIPDETRQSNQSVSAMKGLFRRDYGRTKKFPKVRHPNPGLST